MTDITPTPPLKKRKTTKVEKETKAEKEIINKFSFAPSVYSNTLADLLDFKSAKNFGIASKTNRVAMTRKFEKGNEKLDEIYSRLDELEQEYKRIDELEHDEKIEEDFKKQTLIFDEMIYLAFEAPNQLVHVFHFVLNVLRPSLTTANSLSVYMISLLSISQNNEFQEKARYKHWEELMYEIITTIQRLDSFDIKHIDHNSIRTLGQVGKSLLESKTLSEQEKIDLVLQILPIGFEIHRYLQSHFFVHDIKGFSKHVNNTEILNWLRRKKLDYETIMSKQNQNQALMQKLKTIISSIKFLINYETDLDRKFHMLKSYGLESHFKIGNI